MKIISFAAQLALLAYNNKPSVEGYIVRPFVSGNVQGFTARKGDNLWIVFCGTNDAQDWLDNLNARKIERALGCVHAGFDLALDEVWNDVLAETGHNRWTSAHFVGHSLGGALAALAASRMVHSSFSIHQYLWTFGQPRCGDELWSEAMNFYMQDKYTRVFNAGDPVPHLPTCWRFAHAGRELFFDHDGWKAKSSWWSRVSEAFKALVTSRKAPLATLNAHSMYTYRGNVAFLGSI
ncbi:MAG: lipase family protein [Magnetococcus sp. YQC-5]